MPLTRKQKQRNAVMLKTAEPVPPTQIELEKMTGEEFGRAKNNATDYYRLEGQKKDGKKIALEYAKQTPQFSQRLKQLRAVKDWRYGAALSAEIQCVLKGWPSYNKKYAEYWETLPGTSGKVRDIKEYINNKLELILVEGEKDTKEEDDDKPKVERKSPIELYREKVWDTVMTDVYDMEDDWIEGKRSTIDAYTLFQKYGLTSKANGIVEEVINKWLVEYVELMTARKQKLDDDWNLQLIEGYSHLDNKEVKWRINQLNKIMEDLNKIKMSTKANKSGRVRKPKAADKQVAKLNYMPDCAEHKVVSVHPTTIIGAHRLILFNCKDKKIVEYFSDRVEGFEVKGQALQHVTSCRGKKLRKADEFLQTALSKTEKQFDKEYQKLTTKEYNPNGRFNNNFVILRIDKRR